MKRRLLLVLSAAVLWVGVTIDPHTQLLPPPREERIVQNLAALLRGYQFEVVVDGGLPRSFSAAAERLVGEVRELAFFGYEKRFELNHQQHLSVTAVTSLVHLLPSDKALIVILETKLIDEADQGKSFPGGISRSVFVSELERQGAFLTPRSFIHYHPQFGASGVMTVFVVPYDPKELSQWFFLSSRQEEGLTAWNDGPRVGLLTGSLVLLLVGLSTGSALLRRRRLRPQQPVVLPVLVPAIVSAKSRREVAPAPCCRLHPQSRVLDDIEKVMSHLPKEVGKALDVRLDQLRANDGCSDGEVTGLFADVRNAVRVRYDDILATADKVIANIQHSKCGVDRSKLERGLAELRVAEKPRISRAEHLLYEARIAAA